MDIESVNKYLNKDIILVLRNGFNYRGKITKIYNSSFDFLDCIGNELTVDISNVSLMQVNKDKGILDGEKKGYGRSYGHPLLKNPNDPATERQIGLLKTLKYNGDVKQLTKLEADKLIKVMSNKDKKEEDFQDY